MKKFNMFSSIMDNLDRSGTPNMFTCRHVESGRKVWDNLATNTPRLIQQGVDFHEKA